MRRLRDRVERVGPTARTPWDATDSGFVGGFKANHFWVRVARATPQFYATHLVGRIEERAHGSAVIIHFGHRRSATVALWIIRGCGLLLFAGALMAGVQQPIFLVGAAWVAAGTLLLLWINRLRAGDMERLRSLVVSATQADNP